MLSKRILTLVFAVAFLFVGCFPSVTPPVTENQEPTITSTAITTATVGVAYTYNVDATDPDGDTLTYSLDLKPSGMTINPANGLIKWTPTAKGVHPVVVKVSDGDLYITQSFSILVIEPTPTPVNQAPVIYSSPITTATVGVTYVYDVNATDPDGDTLTYSLTAYSSGMTINSANGLIMWVPTAKGNYAVVVNVSDGALSDTQGFTITVSELPVINQAPVITSTPNLTVTVGVKYTYTIKATDPDGDTITYYLVSEPTGMTFDDIATISWTPVLGQVGTHNVTVKASDGKKDATQAFTITVSKVPELITIRWLEDAVRYNADGSFHSSWQDNHNPSLDQKYPAPNPATLILIGGGYHFADVQEYFNWDMEYEGDIVIDETGQLSGYATYTLDELPIESDFAGQVEIIIGEVISGFTAPAEGELAIDEDHDGIMVGTYTQIKYAFGSEGAVTAIYPEAIKCEGNGDKWLVQYTYYTAHGQ